MYFFSGEATCLKVIPAWAVMSVKAGFAGCGVSTWEDKNGTKARIANKEYFLKIILQGRPYVSRSCVDSNFLTR